MPAFGLVLRPEVAAITMAGSSILVAVDALTLKRLKLPDRGGAAAVQGADEDHNARGVASAAPEVAYRPA